MFIAALDPTALLNFIFSPVTIVVICVFVSCPTAVPFMLVVVASRANRSSSSILSNSLMISYRSSKKFTFSAS